MKNRSRAPGAMLPAFSSLAIASFVWAQSPAEPAGPPSAPQQLPAMPEGAPSPQQTPASGPGMVRGALPPSAYGPGAGPGAMAGPGGLAAPGGTAAAGQGTPPVQRATPFPGLLPFRGVQEGSLNLRGTAWETMDTTVPLRRIYFGETYVASHFVNDEVQTLWADFSGTHPDCLGYPRCVLGLHADGRTEALFFGGDENSLHSIDCVDWRVVGEVPEMPSNEAIESNGASVVWRNEPVLCLHMGRPLYERAR